MPKAITLSNEFTQTLKKVGKDYSQDNSLQMTEENRNKLQEEGIVITLVNNGVEAMFPFISDSQITMLYGEKKAPFAKDFLNQLSDYLDAPLALDNIPDSIGSVKRQEIRNEILKRGKEKQYNEEEYQVIDRSRMRSSVLGVGVQLMETLLFILPEKYQEKIPQEFSQTIANYSNELMSDNYGKKNREEKSAIARQVEAKSIAFLKMLSELPSQ